MRPILVAPFYILIQSIAAIYGEISNLIYNIYIYNIHELVKFIGAIEIFNITHMHSLIYVRNCCNFRLLTE